MPDEAVLCHRTYLGKLRADSHSLRFFSLGETHDKVSCFVMGTDRSQSTVEYRRDELMICSG